MKLHEAKGLVGDRAAAIALLTSIASKHHELSVIERSQMVERAGLGLMKDDERILMVHEGVNRKPVVWRGSLDRNGILHITSRLVSDGLTEESLLEAFQKKPFDNIHAPILVPVKEARANRVQGGPKGEIKMYEIELAPSDLAKLKLPPEPTQGKAEKGKEQGGRKPSDNPRITQDTMENAVEKYRAGESVVGIALVSDSLATLTLPVARRGPRVLR